MISRVTAAVFALAVVLGMTTGCQPEPTPSPSGPVFANEQEAFAAAEETYRAYVDALNQVDLSDPETFEAVYAWTTGELNASDRKNFSAWHADGYVKSGDAVVQRVVGSTARDLDKPSREIDLDVCYDVSGVEVTDQEGTSVVSPDRPDIQTLKVRLVASETPTELAIDLISGSEGDLDC